MTREERSAGDGEGMGTPIPIQSRPEADGASGFQEALDAEGKDEVKGKRGAVSLSKVVSKQLRHIDSRFFHIGVSLARRLQQHSVR